MLSEILDNLPNLAETAWTALANSAEWASEVVLLTLSSVVLIATVSQVGPILAVWLAGAPLWAVVMVLFGV